MRQKPCGQSPSLFPRAREVSYRIWRFRYIWLQKKCNGWGPSMSESPKPYKVTLLYRNYVSLTPQWQTCSLGVQGLFKNLKILVQLVILGCGDLRLIWSCVSFAFASGKATCSQPYEEWRLGISVWVDQLPATTSCSSAVRGEGEVSEVDSAPDRPLLTLQTSSLHCPTPTAPLPKADGRAGANSL